MIKPLLTLLGVTASLSFGSLRAQAQATLGTSPYLETFDGLATGLPTGFGIYTGATASSLGTAATLTTAATAWNNTAGAFKNFASADIGSTATTAAQAAATDRALGVRQTGSLGDPGASFVFQVANTSGRTDFALTFSLQSLDAASPRTTVWTVDYGLGAAPTSFTALATGTTGGSAFSNTPIKVSFGTALDDNSGPVTIRVSTLAASTGSGNRPSSAIDDFQLSWNTPSATTPVLTVTPNALAFGSQNINTASAPQSYSLSGVNLSGATTVTATGPFTVSKTATGTYGSSLSYAPAELTTATSVYVRFAPTATGPATGSISNASAGATSRPVALTGTGADPNQTVFSFDNCTTTLSDGWSQYSVTGPQVWACTAFGHSAADPTASAPNGVQMNGYASGNIANEDWFISPAFNLSAYNFPLLSFWSRTAFNGPSLKLRVSTNYSGTGDPNAATWTDVNAQFPASGSDVWTQTAGVNLAAFKSAKVYVAFVYTSTSSAAARWTLDDIALTNSATPPAPTLLTDVKSLAFGYVAAGSSADRTLNVSGADLTGPVTITSTDPLFTLSKDGTTFATSLTLTAAEVSATTKAVTVRFRPTTAFATFTGTLNVSTPGAGTALSVALSGDTYNTDKTLEVVNWNIEWFGSTQAGLGPNNKDLQQANVTTVASYLNADVYALEEVVDIARLQSVVTQLSANTGHPYAYMVSDYGSYGDNPQDPDYAADQKLAFVYRTDVVSNPTFMGLLRCSEADACPAYNAWAGGRFPYLMHADVTLDGVTKPVNFIVIHAKANATATSANDYARRQLGATLLKNLLDTQYKGQNNLIVGDYNDVLNGTIATGVTPAVSSYNVIVQDSATYRSITLPLARAGAQSTVSFATVIDNVIASGPLASYYINGTAAVRTDAAALVANYGTTTTDHYPVFTRYSFSTPDLVVSSANQTIAGGTYNSITVTGAGAGTLQGPVTVIGAVTVQSGGRLDTNCQPLTGAGSFTVADGATLGICDAAGLSATGSTGAVQVTGTRSFSADATYVYSGTSAQATGLGLPSQVRALTAASASALTLSQPLAVAQTLTLASSGNLVLGSQPLTLLSSASGTALVVNSGTGTVQGTATVQRYIDGSLNAGLGYRHLSAPVSNTTVADLSTTSFAPVLNPAYNTSATPGAVQPFPTVFGYDESRLTTTTNDLPAFDKGFYSPANTSAPLVVAQGYTVNMAANQVVDFMGMLNNGDYTRSLTRTDQTANGGWQLLGNPYPSPLDWSLVTDADRPGLNAAVYVFNSTGPYAGRYRSYTNGMGGGSPLLALGQGFFVQVAQNKTSASLALHNSQRVTSYATQASLLRTTADPRPRLALSLAGPSGAADDLYVYAEAGATTGFDGRQDAAKLPNTTGFNLAALTPDGQPLSIQALPSLSGRVALRVLVPADGTYSLTATDLQNLPAGAQPVLEDTKTGQRTPLAAAGASYTFTVATADNADGRFWLNLNAAALATAPSALQAALALYPNPTHERQATLLLPAGTAAGQVQVLDALGRLVRQQALGAGNPVVTLQLAGLPAGVYLVRVQAGNEQATRRLTLE
ncbi:T9SS type A sorting domain-containing protein [Hymenobacter sp. RP-2-7]|uniref:T9SS type A sorting domain-containing protein n=1 Tax=Hymenobacter polaris TaxID=2682546 RepID=A0A7Y0FMM4_9BACT|nr:choice-of-anchor J domain-containing protein [Hymenobacter polaris]NML66028.1 T9SS type A sorting domain-containing protein [Hymenobacter polaris]